MPREQRRRRGTGRGGTDLKGDARLRAGSRATTISITANLGLSALKAIVGITGGSRALVADAIHSFSDTISTAVVLAGLRVSHAPPDERHHYGHQKLESVSAKVVALFLVITGGGIGWSALQDVLAGGDVSIPHRLTAWVAGFSTVVKEALFRYSARVGKLIRSDGLVADAWHHRSDAFSSITALVGIVGARLGQPLLDPVAGVGVGLLILHMGATMYWRSVEQLVDTAPDSDTMERMISIAQNTRGVIQVNEMKARIHGPDIIVDVKICVDGLITVHAGHDIARAVGQRLRAAVPQVRDVLVHVNPCQRLPDTSGTYRCQHCRIDFPQLPRRT